MSSINYNNYTDKQKAELYREAAAAYDALAKKVQPLDATVADFHRRTAQTNRDIADKLDPPQPEWREGDLVKDCKGRLWQYHGSFWYAREFGGHDTELLTSKYGPLTRLLTYDPSKQQYADPHEREVVVSLKDIDLEYLSDWLHEDSEESPFNDLITSIVAKAAREQLKKVEE